MATTATYITARGHNIYPDGRHVAADESLRYRSREVLSESLESAGFIIQHLWGDWDRSPVIESESPELIFSALKPAPFGKATARAEE